MANKRNGGSLRPICFMVMPFGEKRTGSKDGPDIVDFTHLWTYALQPAIESCGYRAVRADQDLGAVIIKDMLERLVASDLVVADVSIANANVYYELGIRHAASEVGCVMIAADWARPVFDVAQITRHTYPLPNTKVDDPTARKIEALLSEKIKAAKGEKSPVHSLVPGYPNVNIRELDSFRDLVDQTYEFQTEVRSIVLATEPDRTKRRQELVDRTLASAAIQPSIVFDLLELIRDTGDWQKVLDFIERLYEPMTRLQFVQEQKALAVSKLGRHAKSIAILESLAQRFGATPELQGLLGGRYKRLFDESGKPQHLDRAIAAYEAGMRLDLNAYYCASNIPRLLRQRGGDRDGARAKAILQIVIEACEAAKMRGDADEWLYPTLLGAAFDLGDPYKARELLAEIRRDDPAKWMHETTVPDIERSLDQVGDQAVRDELKSLLDELNTLQ